MEFIGVSGVPWDKKKRTDITHLEATSGREERWTGVEKYRAGGTECAQTWPSLPGCSTTGVQVPRQTHLPSPEVTQNATPQETVKQHAGQHSNTSACSAKLANSTPAPAHAHREIYICLSKNLMLVTIIKQQFLTIYFPVPNEANHLLNNCNPVSHHKF